MEVTGQAVVYTRDGVKIIDAEVRRIMNNHMDSITIRFNLQEDYLLIGGARTVPTENIYAANAYEPERIRRAVQYGQTKFFRLMLDLMRLAQWEPIHKSNVPLEYKQFRDNCLNPRAFDDQSLYRRYGFTPAMIEFTEKQFK